MKCHISFHNYVSVFLNLFLCMGVLYSCMSLDHMHARCLRRAEEGVEFPGTRVTGGCELPWQCWELSPHHSEEQQLCS